MKQHKIQKTILFLTLTILFCAILSGCSESTQNTAYNTRINTNVTEENLSYDSQFTGVLQGIDRDEKECVFFDINAGTIKQLNFTGATSIKNRYEKEQSSTYLEPGRIFDVYYEEGEKKLVKVEENKDAFEYRKVDDLTFYNADYMITLSDRKFSFDDSMMIFSGDNEITQLELSPEDELTVRGMGTVVYSVQVTAGHGYISFVNYEDFIGGYVSLDSHMVSTVNEDMLMAVREGTYTLSMENGELSGSKRVTVEKDERIVVDMGEFHIAPERVGNVRFVISPSTAYLYINDTLVDSSKSVRLNFGTHKIRVEQEGYQNFNGVLTVSGNEQQTIEISLAKSENDKADIDDDEDSKLVEIPGGNDSDGDSDRNSDNGNGNSGNGKDGSSGDGTGNGSDGSSGDSEDGNSGNGTGNDSDGSSQDGQDDGSGSGSEDGEQTITVKGPKGVNVYLDGALIGTAPASTKKVLGNHTITLYQSGYITKSYEIEVEDDGKNLTLEFPDLLTGFE